MNTTRIDPPPDVYGFLQLCADRRYHRKTMAAFEAVTGLRADQYWIEASAGGAPALGVSTDTARFAYGQGARVMGWAAHGDNCGGFPGLDDDEIQAKLRTAVAELSCDFPEATHWILFASGGEVEVDGGDDAGAAGYRGGPGG
ncbi:MAG TPA: hypothetical protein VEU29_08670 [Actinomycetota bacterium]|nr:hypothetical protein [Actinomycetota bacterium]